MTFSRPRVTPTAHSTPKSPNHRLPQCRGNENRQEWRQTSDVHSDVCISYAFYHVCRFRLKLKLGIGTPHKLTLSFTSPSHGGVSHFLKENKNGNFGFFGLLTCSAHYLKVYFTLYSHRLKKICITDRYHEIYNLSQYFFNFSSMQYFFNFNSMQYFFYFSSILKEIGVLLKIMIHI